MVVGLRERRHQETKAQLVGAAFALFVEHGFEKVTMEQVARAAGVSRSTAYRRYPTKEDIVLEAPRSWLAVFDRAVDELADDATLTDAVAASALAVAQHIDDDHDTVRTAYAILEQSPSLQQTGIATSAWLQRYVDLLERYADVSTEDALTIAGAHLGAIDAMMQHWASTGGTSSVTDATAALLRRLAPILPVADRRDRVGAAADSSRTETA